MNFLKRIYKSDFFVASLVFFGAFLMRAVLITKVPVSMNWDEASFGYNAYSILKTGRDEYGELLPLQFRSVGDYKAPLFIYALVPFVKIFGLSVWTVRILPSLMGSLSVVCFYFLVKALLDRKAAIIASLFLTISPWHIQFTRGGADVGFATFFTLLGIVSFIYAQRNKFFYYLSIASFSLSVYSYFAERLFVPFIFVFLLFVYRENFFGQSKRTILNLTFTALLFALPIFIPLFSSGHIEKIEKTTIFGYSRPAEYERRIKALSASDFSYNLFHGLVLENGFGFLDRYLTHFSPRFLFFYGPSDDPRQFISYMGMLYLFDVFFIILAFMFLKKMPKASRMIVLGWMLLAPIPAAITRDPVHARRAFNLVYPLVFLSSFGYIEFYRQILINFDRAWRILLGSAFCILFLYLFLGYVWGYYFFSPRVNYKGPSGWQWGYKELVETINSIAPNYEKVVVDTTYQGPYIFFLFFNKYPPERYQPQARLVQESREFLGEGAGFDNYEFRPIYWPDDRYLSNTLFAGPPERVRIKDIDPADARILSTINFPNGEIAWLVVEVY